VIHPDDPTAENLTTAELANDLILMRASDVRVEPIRWLWFARIARGGSPTLIEGPPDKGKSTIICDIVARQTRGDVMPGEVPWPGRTVTPGNVVMMLAEDDLGTTVVPRLIAAGADLERVFFVTATRDEKGQVVPFHLTDDGERLARKAREIDAVLIVLDPLVSYLGSRKGRRMDAHSDMDVRQALQPLLELDSAVLAVRHHKKGRGVDPLEAGSGSIAFTALARVVLVALGDPADPERYLLAVAKNNLVRRADRVTLSYTIVPSEHDPSIGRVEWGTASALSAVDILEAHAASASPPRSSWSRPSPTAP
jgi:putative DNA primase/helicase